MQIKTLIITAAVAVIAVLTTGLPKYDTQNSFPAENTVESVVVVPEKYDKHLELKKVHPHDTDSFTQGLFFYDGMMYESCGLYGKSVVFKNIDMATGKAERDYTFEDDIFAEGSVVFKDKLYVLTYKENKVFVFDPDSLELNNTLSYERQGWGITTDGECLIASDGTEKLYFMDEELSVVKTLDVTCNGSKLDNINELEYINGRIYANVWLTDYILVICPESGSVEKILDFSGLFTPLSGHPDDVLNGIAFDASCEKLYITGKRWNSMFEFKIR